MKSNWIEAEAQSFVDQQRQRGVGTDLALAVYATRLLGRDPTLVLHGGGNSSVKTTALEITGERIPVLHVKGSGWDMGDIEAEGLPAVRLEPLRRLLPLAALTDEDMVNFQRCNLLLASAPNPSVETLLHAFLPHKFVFHTHANAVLAVTNQVERCAVEVFGDRVALVPYVMPGFALAKAVRRVLDERPDCEAIVLDKHGVLSFSDDARIAYERMIAVVARAEGHLSKARPAPPPEDSNPPEQVIAHLAPVLRGALAQARTVAGDPCRVVLAFRGNAAIRAFSNGPAVDRWMQTGPVTPDHAIRTKPWPLLLSAPDNQSPEEFGLQVREAIAAYATRYQAYFNKHNARVGGHKKPLDSLPRLIVVKGVGLFAVGTSAREAALVADLGQATIDVIGHAERIGRYQSLPEADLFDMEYWSLEQAKLRSASSTTSRPLAGQIAVITGGAGAIGLATARALVAQGAEIALLDLPGDSLMQAAMALKALPVACDVTDARAVSDGIERVAAALGGIDVLVSNAGAAWQGAIGDLDDGVLRRSFDLNFFAHQNVAKAVLAVMLRQKTGGVLLFNASKQTTNPGPGFGAYGLPKAATLHLARQYALEYGGQGIRANVVNADRIRSGLLTDAMIESRSAARGISEAEYMSGNLLQREVTAEDVAQAFVSLTLARSTTAAILTVDGGNLAAAVR